jgi:hypothetical protein
VTRGDFATALGPLIEHERRFRRGWLSRERESLSVKAIDGLLISRAPSSPEPLSAVLRARRRHLDISPAARSPTPDVPSAAVSRP